MWIGGRVLVHPVLRHRSLSQQIPQLVTAIPVSRQSAIRTIARETPASGLETEDASVL